jgi:hypothetical protein
VHEDQLNDEQQTRAAKAEGPLAQSMRDHTVSPRANEDRTKLRLSACTRRS